MNKKIRLGIIGYGNLGRGAEKAICHQEDLELVAIFTRRPPHKIAAQSQVLAIDEIPTYRNQIDVMILCGGSTGDLPNQGPQYAGDFNTVDSFDLHNDIPQYFAAMDAAAREGGKLSIISIGWDPGLFSLARLLFASVLPEGKSYTFWGKGVSQGHSVALRQVAGVQKAVQYTVPIPETMEQIRRGLTPKLTARQQHRRVCFIVPQAGADLDTIEATIKAIPGYFADYDTTVHFITDEEFTAEHLGMPHGGSVIRSGTTGCQNKQQLELRLALASNPEFTAGVLVAYARAAYRLHEAGQQGARTIFDVPLGSLAPSCGDQLRRELL